LARNVYEVTLIFDTNKYGRDAANVSGQVASLVEKHGGEVLVSRLWEERRLAYPINGQRKGTYWLAYFKLDSKNLTGLERDFRLSESIMRSLTLKVDPRIADALVSHAASGSITQPRPKKPEAPAAEEIGIEVPEEAKAV
jgi:small subunit ribosomal protein S6